MLHDPSMLFLGDFLTVTIYSGARLVILVKIYNYLWAAHIGSFKSFMDGKIIADSTQRLFSNKPI